MLFLDVIGDQFGVSMYNAEDTTRSVVIKPKEIKPVVGPFPDTTVWRFLFIEQAIGIGDS